MVENYIFIHCNVSGRDEISRAATHIVDGVKGNELLPGDIDDQLVSQTLELGEPELLVRTSGEVRLSDFMLWQVRHIEASRRPYDKNSITIIFVILTGVH